MLNAKKKAWLLADDNQRSIILSYLPLTATTATTTSTLFTLPLLTLSSIKQYIPDWNNKFPDIELNLNWLRLPSSPEWFSSSSSSSTAPPPLTSSQLNKLENNLKGALSADEYANLLAHIEQYIDRVTVAKLQQHQKEEEKNQKSQQTIANEEISLHITNLVKENFSFYKYELNDSDCDRIAEKVKAQIKIYIDNKHQQKVETVPFVFSDENIKEIQKVVTQNFEVNKHRVNVDASTSGDIVDFEGILLKVLKSPQLTAYVDEKLQAYEKANDKKFNQLNALIDELRLEVIGIGEHVSKTEQSHASMAANLNVMQAKQENLSNEFVLLKTAQDKKLDLILNEMNLQLAKNSEQQFLRLDQQIRKIILEILGYDLGEEGATGDLDIKQWIKNIFVAKEYLEARLQEINNQSDRKIEEEIQRSAAIIMQEISQKIKREVIVVVDAEKKAAATAQTINVNHKGGGIGEEDVRRIVREALAIYDADKTGLVDYALESAGGQVLSTRCTENYQTKSAQISIFGIPLWYPTNTPRTAITPAVQPGQCWAFQGFPGFLVIQLNKQIFVTGFTMEHIPKILSPNGKIDSAPNNFSVWGLRNENDPEPVLFGKYQFLDSHTNLQYFPVQNKDIDQTYQVVELRIESNLGNTDYTCLYRFRVHGQPK